MVSEGSTSSVMVLPASARKGWREQDNHSRDASQPTDAKTVSVDHKRGVKRRHRVSGTSDSGVARNDVPENLGHGGSHDVIVIGKRRGMELKGWKKGYLDDVST